MSKKKAEKKTANEATVPQGVPGSALAPTSMEESQIAIAAPIAASVRIHTVVLASCNAKRTPDTTIEHPESKIEINIPTIEVGTNLPQNRFYVRPTFELKVLRKDQPDAEPSLTIEASFALVYSVEALSQFDEKSLHAFAHTSGVFNAWPYWREFVQSTTSRMGFTPVLVPSFRI
jgi:preprotein translocase subunit SecB